MDAMVLRIFFPLLLGLFVLTIKSLSHPCHQLTAIVILALALALLLEQLWRSHTPVDSQSLPGDRLCGVGCEENGECGDLVRALASRLCATFEHALYAIPLHRAGEDCIHPHVVCAEFDRKSLHKPNQSPLRRRIGAPVRVAEATGRRGHDDDDPSS